MQRTYCRNYFGHFPEKYPSDTRNRIRL